MAATGLICVHLISLITSSLATLETDHPVEMDYETVAAGLEIGSLIYLDVRNHDEIKTDGKIVGSFAIPLPEISEAFTKPAPHFKAAYGFSKPSVEDDNVVVACRSGRRALAAINALKAIGYISFKIYPGSFLDWKAKGGPIS